MRAYLKLVLWLFGSLLAGLGLQWLYGGLSRWGFTQTWLLTASLHSLLALALLLLRWRQLQDERRQTNLSWTFGPALSILLGSTFLTAVSRVVWPEAAGQKLSPLANWSRDEALLWCGLIFWVPLVEELLFRFGLGRFLQSKAGRWLGLYLSCIIFALAHGQPSAGSDKLPSLAIPLGPFFLALLCELIYWRSRWIGGPVLFHSACNATPLIFLALDPRWLDWLNLLYLNV